MIFSRSTQYAIQILVLLASQPPGRYTMCSTLASNLSLPEAYLRKLMARFTQAGILESNRGRQGGYRMRVSPHAVSLRQVAEVVYHAGMGRECLLGLNNCSDDHACAMHSQWQPVKLGLLAMLEEQSLSRLAEGVNSGRYRLKELNLANLR